MRIPRAAAWYTSDVVRQPANPCRTCSTGFAPLSWPSRTGGSSLSITNGCLRACVAQAPSNSLIVVRLCPQPIHLFLALNLNLAILGVALMRSIVWNNCSVLTPLTCFCVVMTAFPSDYCFMWFSWACCDHVCLRLFLQQQRAH